MRFNQFISSTGTIPSDLNVEYNEELFKRVIDFITNLDPNQLTEEQKSKLVDIISSFNLEVVDHYKMTNYYDTNSDTLGKASILSKRWY
jgi:hypothetical protein